MSADSSDLHSSKPLRTITEHEVIESFARAGGRGEIAVLQRYTPHMLQGALTKGALFQIAFHIEDTDVNADKGVLYSAILFHAATIVLKGDAASWMELRTRPGKLGAFIAGISQHENEIVKRDREPVRHSGVVRPRDVTPTPIHDVLDLVLTRLHFNFDMLHFLHDHLQDSSTKAIVKALLLLKGKEPFPGYA
jgi:hypothetical protein